MVLRGKTIVLGVTGGIAAYKSAALCSKLVQAGAELHVIMTEGAGKFISPLTFQTLSRHPVYSDTFDEQNPSVVAHIDLADRADLLVIAPATANMIAKLAYGLADDMLSTTALATLAPLLVAPAMNVHMLEHPAVQRNLGILAERGVRFAEPGSGQLACGYVGKGRLSEPETIIEVIESILAPVPHLLMGLNILITAGGTMERIDPVRYLTNDSSGKMGFAAAEAALEMGADVTLIAARTSAKPPAGAKIIKVESAQDMMDAVKREWESADIIIKTAAVADYRPTIQSAFKLKKQDKFVIELERNPDILQWIGENKGRRYIIGFAAETSDLERHAMDKLHRKNCDLIVANDVSQAGAGFGSDTNIVSIYDSNGLVVEYPIQSKLQIARQLLGIAAERFKTKQGDNC